VAECSSSVMLTCSDPQAGPDEVPPVVKNEPAPAVAAPSALWVPSIADEVSIQRGFAKFAPREESAPPPVEAPPLRTAAPGDIAALPPDAPDASAGPPPPPATE
jgi:hypothetical protein